MIDMDCVAKAIECCLKYPNYRATIVLHDWVHYYEIYKEVIQPIKSFYCESLWHHRKFYFKNDSILIITLDDEYFKVTRTNCLIFDSEVDEQTRRLIYEPMIVNYTQND